MKSINKSLLAVAVAGTLGMGSVSVMAEDGLSGNVSLVSNYLWRGVVQSNKDMPAIQGGMDYTKGNFSMGTWGSPLGTNGTEIDLYASFKAGPVTIGGIYYYYPASTGSDFYEVNVGGDVGPVSLMGSYQLNGTNPYYVEASYSMPMGKASLDMHVGYGTSYTASGGGAAYDASVGVSGSAGGLDLSAKYSTTSAATAAGNEGKFVVSMGKSM